MEYMDFIKPLSAVLFCFVARNIADSKIGKLRFVVWITIIYIVVMFAFLLNQFIACAAILSSIFLMLYVNGEKALYSFAYSLVTMMVLIISNTTSGIIINSIYQDIAYYDLVANDFSLFTSTLAMNYVFSHMISKSIGLLAHRKLKIKNITTNKSTTSLFIISLVLVFSFMYYTAISEVKEHAISLAGIYVISLLLIMILTHFLVASSIKEHRIVSHQCQFQQLEQYTTNIESMYNNVRSIRHDYTNVLTSMIDYMNSDDMDGLIKYFEKEIVPFFKRMESTNINLGVLSNLEESGLKGIIAVKLICAQEKNIDIVIDISEAISIKSIKTVDLNRVVGILLDNACEEAIKCSKPFINIAFVKNKKTVTLAVINSIQTGEISTREIFEQGFSTKGDGRGFGLSNMKSILGKYPNVLMDTVVEDGVFKQIIHIEESANKEAIC